MITKPTSNIENFLSQKELKDVISKVNNIEQQLDQINSQLNGTLTVSGLVVTTNSVTFQSNSINGSWIIDYSIPTTKISNTGTLTVNGLNVTSTTVTFQPNSINGSQIKDGTVSTSKIIDGQVTSSKIATGQILTSHINDGQVTSQKIATNQVTSQHIATSQVITDKIADGQVTSQKITTNQIQTYHINNNQVTSDKIQQLTNNLTFSNTVSGVGIQWNNKYSTSDYQFIRYYQDASEYSNTYDISTSSNNNGTLVIGVEGSIDNTSGEQVVIRTGQRLIIDQNVTGQPQNQSPINIVEFWSLGSQKAKIDPNGILTVNGLNVISNTVTFQPNSINGTWIIDNTIPTSKINTSGTLTVSGLNVTGSVSITNNLTVGGTITGSLNGNQSSQSKLQTQRTITLSGAVTGSATFDGSQNITISTSVNHNHDDRYYTKTNLQTSGQASVHWDNITNKPTTYTPQTHTHTKSEITDFSHNHTISEITDFAHTHTISEIIDISSASVNYATSSGNADKLDNLDSSQFVRSDVADTVNGHLTINNSITIGRIIPIDRSSITDAPGKLPVIYIKQRGYFNTIKALAGEGDYFYCVDRNPDYTVTSNYPGWEKLFNGDMASNMFIPINNLSTNPWVLEIKKNSGLITATDVLTLILTGHRLGSWGVKFTSWKVETILSDDSYRTVLDRDGVSDEIDMIYVPLHVGPGYYYIKGIRLTVRGATSASFRVNEAAISSLQLRDFRPTMTPAQGLGALDIRGGNMFGDVDWKYGTPKVSGNVVWHAGNDGHGSGLDADLLDGKHASDFANATHTHDNRYLQLSGGTINGSVTITNNLTVNGNIYGNKVYNAVWNDFAELREQETTIEPGYVQFMSEQTGKLTKKYHKYAVGIVSDTYGIILGVDSKSKKIKKGQVPIQVQGRVLQYFSGKLKVGDQVCQQKDGTVRKMKWWEKIFFPEKMLGVVDEIPTYETWGEDNVKVNGRIWIRVK